MISGPQIVNLRIITAAPKYVFSNFEIAGHQPGPKTIIHLNDYVSEEVLLLETNVDCGQLN